MKKLLVSMALIFSLISLSTTCKKKQYCVECFAVDSTDKVVNVASACDESEVYIENWVIGFTEASDDLGRTAYCYTWTDDQ